MNRIGSKFLDKFFKQVDGVCWDLLSGKIGFQSSDGIITLEMGELSDDKNEAPDAQVSINMFDDWGMPIPAYAQGTSVDSIILGDMIYSSQSGNILGWVVKKSDKSFKLMKKDGTVSSWTPPKTSVLNFDSGVMVIRSLMNMLPGGESGLGQMQSSLLPLMMMGGDGEELKSMMPLLLMSQVGTLGTGGSPNMMNNMVQMMMMQKMMGGKLNMFGGKSSGINKNFFDV